jgi:hypothetical protein
MSAINVLKSSQIFVESFIKAVMISGTKTRIMHYLLKILTPTQPRHFRMENTLKGLKTGAILPGTSDITKAPPRQSIYGFTEVIVMVRMLVYRPNLSFTNVCSN